MSLSGQTGVLLPSIRNVFSMEQDTYMSDLFVFGKDIE